MHSHDSRNDLKGHLGTVLIPVLPILSSATGVVAVSSINQKDRQIHGVVKGKDVLEEGRETPAEGGQHLRDVMKVSRDGPVAGSEE